MKSFYKTTLSLILVLLLIFVEVNFSQNSSSEDEILFAFITDIHIQTERNAIQGFSKAIEQLNDIKPEFVLTGGDLLFDVLAVNYERADSLFNIYNEMLKLIKSPVYNTIGNHDVFGWYDKSNSLRDHPEFGKKMYLNRIGKTYYSFNHKNIKVFVLDSIEEIPEKGKYYGFISNEQIEWLKDELSRTDKSTFLIISTHIPFVTTLSQIRGGSMAANERGLVVENAKEVLDLFKEHNLRLVLQGHLHFYEELNIQNKIKFITGGAVSGKWWQGNNQGLEEGFVILRIKGNEIKSEYFDYNWVVD